MKGEAARRGPFTVALVAGDGLVARFGEVVVFVADPSPTAAPLLAAAETFSAAASPGADIAGWLATVESPSAFGVVAATAAGVVIVLRGAVLADVVGAEQLSAQPSQTRVAEIGPLSNVSVSAAPGVTGVSLTDLRAGVVLGGGFVLTHSPSSPDVTSVASVLEPDQTLDTPSADVTGVAQVVRPPPTASEIAAFADADAVLIAEDGTTYPLDRAYVIGRDPLRAAEVRDSLASPIVMERDQHISRVHAYISVDDGAVFIRDNSTPGGTYIAGPGVKEWAQIGSTPTRLAPGWSIMIGEQILTYRQES